jgi:hypothetical protein
LRCRFSTPQKINLFAGTPICAVPQKRGRIKQVCYTCNMARRYPSDISPFSDGTTVGDVRDELNEWSPKTEPEKRLLEIAQGLSKLLHLQVDHDSRGLKRILPEEAKKLADRGDEFVRTTPVEFPKEDRRLLEEN